MRQFALHCALDFGLSDFGLQTKAQPVRETFCPAIFCDVTGSGSVQAVSPLFSVMLADKTSVSRARVMAT